MEVKQAEAAVVKFSPEVADFVYQVLCARARKGGGPLESAQLRGLMLRCGVRPAQIAPISARPVELLNLNQGTPEELSLVASLFSQALQRTLDQLSPRQQKQFRPRLNGFVSLLRATTPYPLAGVVLAPVAPPEHFLPEPEPEPPPTPAKALEALERALTPLRAVRSPRPAPQMALRKPRFKRPSSVITEVPWGEPEPAAWRVAAAHALLEEALPSLAAPPPLEAREPARPPRPKRWQPRMAHVLELTPEIPGHYIQRAGLTHSGQLDGWRGLLVRWIGFAGLILGGSLVAPGILLGLKWSLILSGALVILVGLAVDFWFEMRSNRFQTRQRGSLLP